MASAARSLALASPPRGAQCQRPRLSLRCESVWGGPHDLKSLASVKGKKKRIVWLEPDATRLLRTLRGVRSHASDFRLVHLVWDPLQACLAQWPHLQPLGARPGIVAAAENNMSLSMRSLSLSTACDTLRLDAIPPLYKRAKRAGRYKTRALQVRLEDLVGRNRGPPAWRQLFKFLGAPTAGTGRWRDCAAPSPEPSH